RRSSDLPTVLANLSAPADTTDTLAPTVWLADALGFTVARFVVTVVGLAVVAWAALRARDRSPTSRPGYSLVGIDSPPPARATARSFAIAVTVSVLIPPALSH